MITNNTYIGFAVYQYGFQFFHHNNSLLALYLSLKTNVDPILEFVQVGNTGNINIGYQKIFPV